MTLILNIFGNFIEIPELKLSPLSNVIESQVCCPLGVDIAELRSCTICKRTANSKNCSPPPSNKFDLKAGKRSLHGTNRNDL